MVASEHFAPATGRLRADSQSTACEVRCGTRSIILFRHPGWRAETAAGQPPDHAEYVIVQMIALSHQQKSLSMLVSPD